MTIPVEPLRETLLEQVERERDEALADADRRAQAIVGEAERQGLELVERARAEGTAAAGLVGVGACVEARRRGRALVLAAQRELYDELHRRAVAGAQQLRDSPAYPALVARLSTAARTQLGSKATIVVDEEGGIRAHEGARSVDYTLPTLAERCLEWLGADVERLWRA
jgi:vacuolar-type H+-ATPase subunit E/Vma4